MMIRAHVSGIAKENLGFFPLRQGFDLRVFLLEPLLHQGLVTLLRAVQGLLAGDAEIAPAVDQLNWHSKTTPNLSLISFATMSRVQSAKANFSCNGFFCVIVL